MFDEIQTKGDCTNHERQRRQKLFRSRRRRLDMERRERENRERKKREEHDKWWTGAELLYGSRIPLVPSNGHHNDRESNRHSGALDGDTPSQVSPSTAILTDEDKSRLKERYSLEYSRWDTWTPQDPATLSEEKEREEEEEHKRSEQFEENNAEFCAKMIDDMKVRSEAREKKENDANAARLKGNRFYKAKRWEKALELYMSSLRAAPYAVNTLANVAQTSIKLERWVDAVEFCERALHVHPGCVKALSRRATVFVQIATLKSSRPNTDIITSAVPAKHSASSQDTATDASCTMKDAEPSNEVSATVECGKISTSEREGQGVGVFRERYGGREELMKLALSDLEKAVEVDPEGEDVRRQRDHLKREIEEEKIEAEVMQRARKIAPPLIAAGNDHQTSDGRVADYDDGDDADSVGEAQKRSNASTETLEFPQDALKNCGDFFTSQGKVDDTGSPPEGRKKQPMSNGIEGAWSALEEDDEIVTVDKLLDEALCASAAGEEDSENVAKRRDGSIEFQSMGMLSDPLLRLTRLLESSSTARVYLRASGGLARLAAAAAVATAPTTDSTKVLSSDSTGVPKAKGSKYEILAEQKGSAPIIGVGSASDAESSEATTGCVDGINGSRSAGHGGVGGAGCRRFGALLSAVAAAMCGGERLAQQEVWRSGLLDRCGRALQAACDVRDDASVGTFSKESLAETWGTAGAAALVIWNAADDVEVRAHVARSTSLLSGLVGVIAANSAAPLAVQAAAETLRGALLGKTAPTATKSLRGMAAAVGGTSEEAFAGGKGRIGSPAAVLGGALQAWRKQTGRMQDASVEVGEALCGALANLALHADFRDSFADLISRRSFGASDSVAFDKTATADTNTMTTATVLVLIAGDRKEIDRSEAKSLALAALMNACLHTQSAQAATFSAGGLVLALAFLSLEGEERTRNVPPLVAARSAGLLARLSPHLPALEAMARLGVVERIMKAIVRSASLGGNIYNSVSPTTKPIPTSAAAAATWTAASIERENLVRTLAAILRCPLVANRAHPEHISGVRVPAPSSNVHDDDQNQEEYGAGPSMTKVKKESISDHSRVVAANPRKALEGTEEFPRYATKTAEEHGLVSALIGFLPPAREDGLEGVTKNSVALIPGWSAPPSLTANVCGCLLHLLGDSEAGTSVANQVVKVGGISRLISLFANSGESASFAVRKNAAICLAKLAREPSNKKIMTDLRGMEMLLQAGSGLGV